MWPINNKRISCLTDVSVSMVDSNATSSGFFGSWRKLPVEGSLKTLQTLFRTDLALLPSVNKFLAQAGIVVDRVGLDIILFSLQKVF